MQIVRIVSISARHLGNMLALSMGLVLLGPSIGYGQETPETEAIISVGSDAGGSETLTLGLDPDATSGIDSLFGESELPPVPPSGAFDARWIDNDISPSALGEGVLIDIRRGSSSSNGTRQHELQIQAEDSATEVTIEWNLPAGVTGTIEDKFDGSVYGPVEMEGNGSLTITPGDPDAILTIDYNAPPTLNTNEGTTLDEGQQVTISSDSLSASDPDSSPSSLTFAITDGPADGDILVGGTASTAFTQKDLIDGKVAYNHTADIPPGDIPPDDRFTFDLTDSKGEGPTGNVFSVSVLATNDPPTAESDADTTQQGTSNSIPAPGVLANDSDPNGDPLSVSQVNGSASDVGQQVTLASGALLTVGAGGAYNYAPNGAFEGLGVGETGSDSFTYTASDGNGEVDQATVTLTIEGVNDSPVATNDDQVTDEGSVASVATPGLLENDSDPDGDPLSVSKANGNASDVGRQVTLPSGALLTVDADGAYSYAPNGAFESLGVGETGSDSFTYTASDGNGDVDQATVNLTINGVNGAPTAAADNFVTHEDSTLTVEAPGVLGNDGDPDGDPLTASIVSAPGSGTLTLNGDGSFEYVAASGFADTESFTYEVSDGNGGTDQTTVTLEVHGEYTLTIDDGWNMLSIPYNLDDQTFGAVLPSCTSGFFFEPGSGTQSIADGETVPAGQGFWANCTSDTVQLVGQAPSTSTVDVAAGWNMIGPVADSVDTDLISSDPLGLAETLYYGFDQSDGYTSASVLVPGNAYWVKASQNGTLDLGGGTSSKRETVSRRSNGRAETNKIRLQVADAEGREATLWLSDAAPPKQVLGHELPPAPPGDLFDVRFASGTSLATWESTLDEAPFRDVHVQGMSYPLTLRLVGPSSPATVHVKVGSGFGARTTTLTPEVPSMTLHDESDGLRLAMETVPNNFVLERSAPNPARGQVTIEYSVPKQTRVQIDVHDVLGRKVATLADRRREAGQYRVRFDVGSLSSGTYFYRLSAGDFSETRRMDVVR